MKAWIRAAIGLLVVLALQIGAFNLGENNHHVNWWMGTVYVLASILVGVIVGRWAVKHE